MNKDAEGRWKVGRSYIKLKMRAKSPAQQKVSLGVVWLQFDHVIKLLNFFIALVWYPLHSGDPKILWVTSRRLAVPVGDDRAVRRRIERDRLLNELREELAATA